MLKKRPVDSTPVDLDNVSVGVGQEFPVVLREESVASSSEVDAATLPNDIRSMQVTGDVRNQRSIGRRGVHQEEEGCEDIKVEPGPGDQNHAIVGDPLCVTASERVGATYWLRLR